MRTAAAAALLVVSAAAATFGIVRLLSSAGDHASAPRGETVGVMVPAPPAPAGTAPATAPVAASAGAPEAQSPLALRQKTLRTPPPAPPKPPSLPRVTIKSIGVSAHIVSLGLSKTGELQRPPNYTDVGWWSGGTAMGRKGVTLLAGHVDSSTGPAVFYRLTSLRRNAIVLVEDRDGRRYRYRITNREQVRKDAFPTQRVYAKTKDRVIRLITCGGPFRPEVSSYRDNIIFYGVAA
jgi:sortase (surface protein transpeptidase)